MSNKGTEYPALRFTPSCDCDPETIRPDFRARVDDEPWSVLVEVSCDGCGSPFWAEATWVEWRP